MTPDDGDVIGKAVGLDTAVFDTLYAEYKTPVYRFAYCLSRDKEEADELFQETWLRVVQYYPRTSRVRHFRTWVFAITANLHRDMLRKKRIRRLFLKEANRTHHNPVEMSMSKCLENNACIIDDSDRVDMKDAITQALAKLPDRQRRVFILKEIEGFKHTEIGEILGVPVGTTKSLMYRAVKRLQKDLSVFKQNVS